MNKRTITAISFFIFVISIALLAFWTSNATNPSETKKAEQRDAKSMDDIAAEYAENSSSLEQALQDINSLVEDKQLTVEEADWLKARVAELRDLASRQQTLEQPETVEEYLQYFVGYNSQFSNEVKTIQRLYDQYVQNPGPNAPITQSTLQALNQVKLKENINIMGIDAEISQLIFNGTLTNEQAIWLKEQVHHQFQAP